MTEYVLSKPIYHPQGVKILRQECFLATGSDSVRSESTGAECEVRLIPVNELDPGRGVDNELLQVDGRWTWVWRSASPLALVVSLTRGSVSEFEALVASIPAAQGDGVAAPPNDRAFESMPSSSEFARWLRADVDGDFEVQEHRHRSGEVANAEARYVQPNERLAYLAIAESSLNPLYGMAMGVPQAAQVVGLSIPTVVGQYPDGRSQAMWTHRQRFWHYMLTEPLDALVPRVLQIQEDVR